MASIYRRGDTWWIKFNSKGKVIRESLKTANKRIAEREKQARETELLNPHRHAPVEVNPAIEAFWSEYIEWARQHKRPRTIERESIFWRQLIEFVKPSQMGDVTPRDLMAFVKWRKECGNSNQTLDNALKDIQAIYNHAIRMGLYTGSNPATKVSRFKIDRALPEFHTDEELARLLDAARKRGSTVERVVLLGAWAGLRRAEIVNCRWEWFDFSSARPLIKVKRFPNFEIKDRDERVIPMNQRIYDSFHPCRKAAGFVFELDRHSAGKNRYRFDPKKSLVAALKEAGLTTSNPFQRLRHTFGSLLAQKGVSIFKVSKWMGHSSVKVTERHYAGLQAYDPEIDSF